MIKGRVKKEYKFLDADGILDATNGGHDIFCYYLGKVERLMQRPWGKKEKKISWGIYPHGKIWMWKDQANEETGTAIHFVQKMFGLTFIEAKDKICWDFGIGGKEINSSPVIITWDRPEVEEQERIPINFTTKPYEKRHHEFWNIVQCTEEHCNKYNCFAVKDLAINRKKVWIGKDEIVFAFWCPEEDAVKIYFPDREKEIDFVTMLAFIICGTILI